MSNTTTIRFPPGAPKQHEAMAWGRLIDSKLTEHGITSVARARLPTGKFKKKWSAGALEPPPALPSKPSYKDQMSHRQAVDTIEARVSENAFIQEQRDAWWQEYNHLFFQIITDSMINTNPSMRDLLRDRYHVIDGYYDGYDAFEHVKKWLNDLHRRQPGYNYYEEALSILERKRLPTGAGEAEFGATVRRFMHDINPYIRAPYAEQALGEYIIEKLLPASYVDAIDRLLDEMKADGTISDASIVEDRCREVVRRRTKGSVAASTAHAYVSLDQWMASEGAFEVQPTEKLCPPVGTPLAAGKTPDGAFVFNMAMFTMKKFCGKCVDGGGHKLRDGSTGPCFLNFTLSLDAELPPLRRIAHADKNLVKLGAERTRLAKVVGQKPKPLPTVEPLEPGYGMRRRREKNDKETAGAVALPSANDEASGGEMGTIEDVYETIVDIGAMVADEAGQRDVQEASSHYHELEGQAVRHREAFSITHAGVSGLGGVKMMRVVMRPRRLHVHVLGRAREAPSRGGVVLRTARHVWGSIHPGRDWSVVCMRRSRL